MIMSYDQYDRRSSGGVEEERNTGSFERQVIAEGRHQACIEKTKRGAGVRQSFQEIAGAGRPFCPDDEDRIGDMFRRDGRSEWNPDDVERDHHVDRVERHQRIVDELDGSHVLPREVRRLLLIRFIRQHI